MNALFITRWGMDDQTFPAFYNDFRKKLDLAPHSQKVIDAFNLEKVCLAAVEEGDGHDIPDCVELALTEVTKVPIFKLNVVATETFTYKAAERRPVVFKLILVEGCVEDRTIVWKTFEELREKSKKGFDFKNIVKPHVTSGSLMLYEGSDSRWVRCISRETQDAVSLFRGYAGNYPEQAMKVMLCGLPMISKLLSKEAHISKFKDHIASSICNAKFKPHPKWSETLSFFRELNEIVKGRLPSELEVIEPKWHGTRPDHDPKIIPVLILFSYRPEIEGEHITPFDIRETRLWWQYKNEST